MVIYSLADATKTTNNSREEGGHSGRGDVAGGGDHRVTSPRGDVGRYSRNPDDVAPRDVALCLLFFPILPTPRDAHGTNS